MPERPFNQEINNSSFLPYLETAITVKMHALPKFTAGTNLILNNFLKHF